MSSRIPTDEHSPFFWCLLQAQQAPALPYAKVVGSTGSYPAPLPNPATLQQKKKKLDTWKIAVILIKVEVHFTMLMMTLCTQHMQLEWQTEDHDQSTPEAVWSRSTLFAH